MPPEEQEMGKRPVCPHVQVDVATGTEYRGVSRVVTSRSLRRSFIVYEVNHTILLIDMTSISLPREVFPPEGKAEDLLSLRFQAWRHAEKFMLDGGASRDSLDKTRESLNKNNFAIINILN